jgi:hypothetical protein
MALLWAVPVLWLVAYAGGLVRGVAPPDGAALVRLAARC